MSSTQKPEDAKALEVALKRCADEPIHIPGLVQSCGVLLGVAKDTLQIVHASENSNEFFGHSPEALFQKTLPDLLSAEELHDLSNAFAKIMYEDKRHVARTARVNGQEFHLSCSADGDIWVLEFEPVALHGLANDLATSKFSALMDQIYQTKDTQELLDKLVMLFSVLTNYDRILVYRFDSDWNGDVVAERLSRSIEPFLGLRFPHWDIPEQARTLMFKLPIRYIANAKAPQIPIVSKNKPDAPLDITFAQLRGTSPIHLQYLENMDVAASMTLSLVVDGQLWGIVSFHHQSPMVPDFAFRHLCEGLLPLINTKLHALQQSETIALHDEIDGLRLGVSNEVASTDSALQDFEQAVQTISERLGADGIVLGVDDQTSASGCVVSDNVMSLIRARAASEPSGIWCSDCLRREFPEQADDLGSVSGALCMDRRDGRWICMLRKSRSDDVKWAGAPSKDIDTSDGMARLHPRGSFTLYQETVKDTSVAWQKSEIKLLEGISLSLLAANQRKMVLSAMRRQQELVVDELNHRVRNILTLVKSISRQARKENASLDSYSNALEQRINSLATAHDLGASQSLQPVSIHNIIRLESEPHLSTRADTFSISGKDCGLLPQAAPIFALVIHELITNAVKYGALSSDQGQVIVSLQHQQDGLVIRWVELGGPPVVRTNERGFGTNLIEQAIPYELGGKSEIVYNPTGLNVTLQLPNAVLEEVDPTQEDAIAPPANTLQGHRAIKPRGGTVLVVEDNFMIAVDMMANLKALGFEDTELAANHEQAKRVLDAYDVVFAVLDINLGRGGTSEELAHELDAANIPFMFVTGYGDLAPLPDEMSGRIKLTKPVSLNMLEASVNELIGHPQVS